MENMFNAALNEIRWMKMSETEKDTHKHRSERMFGKHYEMD
jgi:hypothetical protein